MDVQFWSQTPLRVTQSVCISSSPWDLGLGKAGVWHGPQGWRSARAWASQSLEVLNPKAEGGERTDSLHAPSGLSFVPEGAVLVIPSGRERGELRA